MSESGEVLAFLGLVAAADFDEDLLEDDRVLVAIGLSVFSLEEVVFVVEEVLFLLEDPDLVLLAVEDRFCLSSVDLVREVGVVSVVERLEDFLLALSSFEPDLPSSPLFDLSSVLVFCTFSFFCSIVLSKKKNQARKIVVFINTRKYYGYNTVQ